MASELSEQILRIINNALHALRAGVKFSIVKKGCNHMTKLFFPNKNEIKLNQKNF